MVTERYAKNERFTILYVYVTRIHLEKRKSGKSRLHHSASPPYSYPITMKFVESSSPTPLDRPDKCLSRLMPLTLKSPHIWDWFLRRDQAHLPRPGNRGCFGANIQF
jgi:hypothetical protein